MTLANWFSIPVVLFSAVASASAQAPSSDLALAGGTVYTSPTEPRIDDGTILIRGGVIAAVGRASDITVPKGVPVLDCRGLSMTAGLWNSHVHFIEHKWADVKTLPAVEVTRQVETMLSRYGFTSVFDIGSPWGTTRALRDRIESGEVAGPRIRSTGEPLFPKGSFPPELLPVANAMGLTPYGTEVSSSGEAAAVARQRLEAGTDAIKVYAAMYYPPFPALPPTAIKAAVDEAHGTNKLVFGHPTTRAGLLAAVSAGVDIIAHTTPEAGPWDADILRALTQANVSLIPTLRLFGYEVRHERQSLAETLTSVAVAQLRAWHTQHGEVLFGTDVGYMSEYDPSDEYALMAQAGMTLPQILTSLTTAPAKRFGESVRLGRIATGFVGDVTVLRQDPSRDIRALAAVQYTIRAGRVIFARGT
jgi:imidazolonepropionase-like amidohydrolase